jgi:hypothetical protein
MSNNLKCNQCNSQYNEYDKPKYVPCGKTICTKCELEIYHEAQNKRYKCGLCSQYHDISANGFDPNNEINTLLTVEPVQILRSQKWYQLESNLKKNEILLGRIENFESECVNHLNETCLEEKRRIQLATELKIQKLDDQSQIDQINKSNEDLVEIIDKYEQTCTGDFFTKTASIKETLNERIINKANSFLTQKQEYLNQIQTDDEEIEIFLNESLDLKSRLSKELIKIRNLIFNENKIEFIESLDESILGYIEYDKCFTVSK